MNDDAASIPGRYHRQVLFDGVGSDGQARLARGRALIVGVGGLGCTVAQLLVRSGVGFLRLVDDDKVELNNIHRQLLFDEADAADGVEKVVAAARRLKAINSEVRLDPVVARLEAASAASLARDVDVIVDGSDNFPTRFLINDLAVRQGLPWVMAGIFGGEGQTMTIVPGRSPCLRCVFEPPAGEARGGPAAVLPAAVTAIAAIEAMEAMKILSGRLESVSPYLLKLDLWGSAVQRIELRGARATDCPCCKRGVYESLDG